MTHDCRCRRSFSCCCCCLCDEDDGFVVFLCLQSSGRQHALSPSHPLDLQSSHLQSLLPHTVSHLERQTYWRTTRASLPSLSRCRSALTHSTFPSRLSFSRLTAKTCHRRLASLFSLPHFSFSSPSLLPLKQGCAIVLFGAEDRVARESLKTDSLSTTAIVC